MTTQRFAASHTSEHTTSTVDIPSDDIKGRIIGREGRNIRAFEKETGVDVADGVTLEISPLFAPDAKVLKEKIAADPSLGKPIKKDTYFS